MLESQQTEQPIINTAGRDKRKKRRFHIEQQVRYKTLYGRHVGEVGTGKTVNISSSGLWFTTDVMLAAGLPMELSMDWPALLNDSCPLKLMVYGCVVRSNQEGAAITIERYEFRTQGANSFQDLKVNLELEMKPK